MIILAASNKTLEPAITAVREISLADDDYFKRFKGMTFLEFNDAIGLPTKHGKPMEIHPYEIELERIMTDKKHIWIKKATGLGITEYTLRWLAWMACKDNSMRYKHRDIDVIIITAPRIDLAITLMNRLKGLFNGHDFKSKETVATINGVRIEAFPSHHLESARGLNPQVIFLDEADFFEKSGQIEARSISERYIAKTNPYIIMVSTPNLPNGLFDQIEKEPAEGAGRCLYHRIFLPYTVGLGNIFTQEEIDAARVSPTFEREYNLQYGVGVGNIYPIKSVDDCTREYDLKLGQNPRVLAIDPAYGSSKFGIIGIERIGGNMYVKTAEQFERPSPSAMLERCVLLAREYNNYCLVDSAHSGLVRDLIDKGIQAKAVNFRQDLSEMTIESAQAVKELRVGIHPTMTDLIAQLKAVQFNDKGHPDKKELTFDLGDAFMMAVNYFKVSRVFSVKI